MNPIFVSNLSEWLMLIIQVCTIITLVYAFKQFASKPNKTQNDRLTNLEDKVKDVDRRLEKGNERFDANEGSNKVMQQALLALLSHAIDGNDVASLRCAKKDLQNYLIEK